VQREKAGRKSFTLSSIYAIAPCLYIEMSNLVANSTKEPPVSMRPLEGVFFEDALQSETVDIYKLLQLSSMRQKDGLDEQKLYLTELVGLFSGPLTQSSDIPMAFRWEIDAKEYSSTSMLFELYCTSLCLAEKLFASANNYKASIHLLEQCKVMLGEWKTAELVYPACPYKCTKEYLDNLLYLTRASMLLAKKGASGMALATAMSFAGKVGFHIPQFSDTALNHYLLARSLLYHKVSQVEEPEQGEAANEAYTAAKESLACCRLLDRSKCHIDTDIDTALNAMLEELPEFLQSMEQVYYSVEVPLESIRLPSSVQA